MKIQKHDPIKLTHEDLRWVKIISRSIDGLAAIAEANAEGCDTEWMAMQYSLEAVKNIMDSVMADFKDRMGMKGDEK